MVAAPSLIAGGREEDSFFVPGQEEIAPAPAAGNALRISGTFLDEISHDIPHQNWGEKEWDRDFRHMRAIGIDTVIMIRSGYRKFITYPSKYLLGKGCYRPSTDLLDMFLRLADKHGMKFYFGLYDSGRYWDTGDLSWEIEDNKYVIDEVWQQYGSKHKSFGRVVYQWRDKPCHQGCHRCLPCHGQAVQGRFRRTAHVHLAVD